MQTTYSTCRYQEIQDSLTQTMCLVLSTHPENDCNKHTNQASKISRHNDKGHHPSDNHQHKHDLQSELLTSEKTINILRQSHSQILLNRGDPNVIRQLDYAISKNIEQHAWQQKE
jgi:hypothetical protein